MAPQAPRFQCGGQMRRTEGRTAAGPGLKAKKAQPCLLVFLRVLKPHCTKNTDFGCGPPPHPDSVGQGTGSECGQG